MLTIYSKPNCPFCRKSKEYLTNQGIDFEEINVQENPGALSFIKAQGHTTVPQFYKNNKLFVAGGYEGLIKLTPSELAKAL